MAKEGAEPAQGEPLKESDFDIPKDNRFHDPLVKPNEYFLAKEAREKAGDSGVKTRELKRQIGALGLEKKDMEIKSTLPIEQARELQQLREERDALTLELEHEQSARVEAQQQWKRAEAALAEMRSKTLDEAAVKIESRMNAGLHNASYRAGWRAACAEMLTLKSGEPAPKEGK